MEVSTNRVVAIPDSDLEIATAVRKTVENIQLCKIVKSESDFLWDFESQSPTKKSVSDFYSCLTS